MIANPVGADTVDLIESLGRSRVLQTKLVSRPDVTFLSRLLHRGMGVRSCPSHLSLLVCSAPTPTPTPEVVCGALRTVSVSWLCTEYSDNNTDESWFGTKLLLI